MSQIRRATTSSSTRKTFLSYFGQHASIPHVIVKSSKVAPPSNDPTLSFVNAGMNSFKRIIEGQAKPPGCQTVDGKSSVANSQKVRYKIVKHTLK
jgi:alanyl-tRNA synthetase